MSIQCHFSVFCVPISTQEGLLCHKTPTNKYACFSPVNLSYVPLILRPRRTPALSPAWSPAAAEQTPYALEKPQVPTGDAARAKTHAWPEDSLGVSRLRPTLAGNTKQEVSFNQSSPQHSSSTIQLHKRGKAKIWQLKSSECGRRGHHMTQQFHS